MDSLDRLLQRAEGLLDRLEALLPPPAEPLDWSETLACQWRRAGARGRLHPVRRIHHLSLDDLLHIDPQKERLYRNTERFVRGYPSNNALLWGSRGTGKSSLVKALLNALAAQGLRLIEVDKFDLLDLPEIVGQIAELPQRFLLFCDDLSFDEGDPRYKTLKAVLDGSINITPDNTLIYATSNRRHLLPEQLADNFHSRSVQGEIHPGEAAEEKISLSDRFGLWLSFYPFSQEQYLDIVFYWLGQLGAEIEDLEAVRLQALRWATARGGRSGRAAHQFARDWIGRAVT